MQKARSKSRSDKEVLRRTQRPRKTSPVPVIVHGRKSIKIWSFKKIRSFLCSKLIAYACFVKIINQK